MITKERVGKAKDSLKNEGPIVFTKKAVRFVPWAVGRTHVKYSKYLPKPLQANTGKYDSDYLYLNNPVFKIASDDLRLNEEVQKQAKPEKIKSATWFVPYFDHLAFGGIYTIFRFINYFGEQGVSNHIVIYDNPQVDAAKMKQEIERAFPNLDKAKLTIFDPRNDKIEDLPPTDIAICTFWVSAYFLLRFNQTKRKYYFIQDYEPLFYEGGSISALAESTYRFGFEGIVNTPGLLRAINQRHGLKGVSFTPAVDSRYYYPPKTKDNKRVRIFFYARPHNPRNAFNLGVMIIKILLKRYGKKIEVVTAGSEWKEKKFDLKGEITNLGLLKSLQEVGDLYRSCDIGFVYMLSKHPSYQPFEFMASGVATVTNNNEDNLWFLKDGTNCLIAEPSPAAMAEKIGWLIDDEKLRHKIQQGGYTTVSTDWQSQLELIWNDVLKS
ncbi:MAG TPA: glycosyltransferase [Candidatus Saccharimonadales bacterium]|nr:glycosyltransferase [Candidatus Saccharimonadales bacterium]